MWVETNVGYTKLHPHIHTPSNISQVYVYGLFQTPKPFVAFTFFIFVGKSKDVCDCFVHHIITF